MSSKELALRPRIVQVMAGVDWISATLPVGVDTYGQWLGAAYEILERIRKEGNILESRKMQGYEGHAIGNCFVGTREDGAFCQITGERANDAYRYLFAKDVHISRLDCQITIQTDIEDTDIGEKAYGEATAYDSQLPPNKQRSIDRWTSKGNGYTLYVGSASSDKRLRLYNKSAQSEDTRYTRCWRYEVVYRNRLSDRMYRSLINAGNDQEKLIVSTVVYFCLERGIHIHGMASVEPVALIRIVEIPSDIERKLKWLEKQVRPTLRKLSDLGYGDQAATAMGLWIPHET